MSPGPRSSFLLLLAGAIFLLIQGRSGAPGPAAGSAGKPGAVALLSGNGLSARRLLGDEVRNLRGERLGRISDLVFRCRDGALALIVIDVEGNYRFGIRHVALPRPAFLPLQRPLTLSIPHRSDLFRHPAIARDQATAPGYLRLSQLPRLHELRLLPRELPGTLRERPYDVLLDAEGRASAVIVLKGGILGFGGARESRPGQALAGLEDTYGGH